jgi:ABC-type polar amino acid transport system ATPase subunit
MHPEVLLLDEITAALDPEIVHEVLQVMLPKPFLNVLRQSGQDSF